jgi:hypothetical protein
MMRDGLRCPHHAQKRTFGLALSTSALCQKRISVRVPECTLRTHKGGLVLQLPSLSISESMGNHDSQIVDAGSVN